MEYNDAVIGAVVTIKSDHSVKMTINSHIVTESSIYTYKDCVYCIWFNNDKEVQGVYIHIDALDKVRESKI